MTQVPVIDRNTHIHIAPNVYAREFGTELILLDFLRGEYFGLDDVGAEIVRQFERGASIGEVVQALTETFEVSVERAYDDVRYLAMSMREKSLVSTQNDG